MDMFKLISRAVTVTGLFAVLAASAAFADDADVSSYYEVKTDGSSQQVKVGSKGTFVLAIKTKSGAHVSDEAPLKIEINGTLVTPEKTKLTQADSVGQKAAGQQHADPRFEVPFGAPAAGKGQLEAKMTFFVCTEKLCSRQQKTLSVPVEVL